jgi:hypothetical protein
MFVSIVITEYRSVYVIKHEELDNWMKAHPQGTVLLIKSFLEL